MMEHSHLSAKIQKIEEQIKRGETIRIQSLTKLESIKEQQKETEAELIKLGINPEDAKSELEKLDQEIINDLADLESLVPTDIIGA